LCTGKRAKNDSAFRSLDGSVLLPKQNRFLLGDFFPESMLSRKSARKIPTYARTLVILRHSPEPKESFTGEGVNHYILRPGNVPLSFD
jgi:hypothetical protein